MQNRPLDAESRTLFQKAIDRRLKGIGIYQLIGGLLGLYITITALLQNTVFTVLVFLIFFIAISLYSYSFYCGILTLKKSEKCLNHSLVNQYLQLVNFTIAGFGFKYAAGVLLSLGLDLTTSFEMKFSFQLSIWQIDINTSSQNVEINFNLIAFFIIMFIDRLKNKIKQNKEDLQISAIGDEIQMP